MTPILHHYPSSPYSEMVRLALGLYGAVWESCEQPIILPRPELMALTGGYRRIPVMQIGADIYCDSHIILRALDRRFNTTGRRKGRAWIVRNWAERAWFAASVGVIFGARAGLVPEAFIKDREQLSGRPFDTAAMAVAAPLLRGQWRAAAASVEDLFVDGAPFLGGEKPGLQDVAAFMNVWFLRSGLPEGFEALTAGLPRLRAWADRMAGLSHGQATPITPGAALARAAAATPAPSEPSDPQEAQGLAPGQRVAVMADDYGRDPVEGVITHVSNHEIAIARETAEAGAVVVHFPRAGFLVRAV